MDELKHIYMLSHEIGPRGSTKSNEELAAQYIKDEMEKTGMDMEVQDFSSVKSFSWTYGFIYLSFVLAFFIFITSPLLAFVICAFSLITFRREANTKETISRLMPKGRSQNILGKIPAQKYPVIKMIFVAHYDTSKSGISFHPEMVKNFRSIFLLGYFSMIVITFVFGISIIFNRLGFNDYNILWYFTTPFALVLFSSFLVLLHREMFGKYTPGANDNASGVSVLLETAREVKNSPPDFIETCFLTTGCEEAGTVGMIRFLEEYKLDKKKTFFINMDNIGSGDLKYIMQEGVLKRYASNDKLVKKASLSAREKPEIKVSGASYHLLTTDATAALARDYNAMTILAMNKEGQLPNWHWHTDTVERIEKDNLLTARTLALRILYNIDKSVNSFK